jgi:hypothetical protein
MSGFSPPQDTLKVSPAEMATSSGPETLRIKINASESALRLSASLWSSRVMLVVVQRGFLT